MKRNRTNMGIFTTIICLMVVFSLLFLPLILVWGFPERAEGTEPKVHKIEETSYLVGVYRTQSKTVEQIPLEDYVKGVIAGEMPADFEEEALKAQAVAARTYAISKVSAWQQGRQPSEHPGAALCDSTHCQVYRSAEELRALKSDEWMESGWKKVSQAAEETAGQVMYYQGELVDQPLFHSSSGGKTENSEAVFASAVPYLRSVASPYEQEATHQNEVTAISASELSKKLKAAYPAKNIGTVAASGVVITGRSEGGRVEKIQVGGAVFTGRQIREALGLPSANFTVGAENGKVTFVTVGYGHGVGMSQYGANGMAQKGSDYKAILTHYYSGVSVEPMK